MHDSTNKPERIAFVGFGEAATAFVTGWADDRPPHIQAYDIKSAANETRAEIEAAYAAHTVAGHATLDRALAGAQTVFSVVTADQALEAARAAASSIEPGTLWLDCNSCAPDTKRQAAELIEKAGAAYVDVAVMAPVHPKLHHVPILLSGPQAEKAEAVLLALDMKPEIAGEQVGQASAIKMLRSVMIKGFEALTAECFLAARRAGVEEAVLASLEKSDPDIQWRRRGAYNLERMMIHGTRRAAEMREVAATVEALGLTPRISSASADWQDEIGALGAEPGQPDLFERADRVLKRL